MLSREKSCGVIPLKKDGNDIWLLALHHRNGGHWALPKGHVEPNESEKQTAERELREETALEIEKWLDLASFEEIYTFEKGEDLVEKQVLYFAAWVKGEVRLQEEEMLGFEWLKLDEASAKMSFAGCKRIVGEIQDALTR